MSNGMQIDKVTYHDSIYTVPDEYMQEEDIAAKEEKKKEDSSCWDVISEYETKEWDSIY